MATASMASLGQPSDKQSPIWPASHEEYGPKGFQDGDGGLSEIGRRASGIQCHHMGHGADPEKSDGPKAEQPDVDQGMLQRQDPIVASITPDLEVEVLDRSRRPLEDMGEHASVGHQGAGDVVQGVMSPAVIEDIAKVAVKL